MNHPANNLMPNIRAAVAFGLTAVVLGACVDIQGPQPSVVAVSRVLTQVTFTSDAAVLGPGDTLRSSDSQRVPTDRSWVASLPP